MTRDSTHIPIRARSKQYLHKKKMTMRDSVRNLFIGLHGGQHVLYCQHSVLESHAQRLTHQGPGKLALASDQRPFEPRCFKDLPDIYANEDVYEFGEDDCIERYVNG